MESLQHIYENSAQSTNILWWMMGFKEKLDNQDDNKRRRDGQPCTDTYKQAGCSPETGGKDGRNYFIVPLVRFFRVSEYAILRSI